MSPVRKSPTWLTRSRPVFIEGTGITLETDEDIAKWIAERKAKWPSAKRQAEKASNVRIEVAPF